MEPDPTALKKLRKLMRLMHPRTTLANTSRTTAVLLEIYLNPGAVVRPIGQHVNLSGGALSQHLKRLAEWGMIRPGKQVTKHEGGGQSLTLRPVVTPLGAQVVEQLAAVLAGGEPLPSDIP